VPSLDGYHCLTTVVAAGFVDFEIIWQADIFSGTPQESSAAEFGTLGIKLSCAQGDQ
jgi:hypothetical protein